MGKKGEQRCDAQPISQERKRKNVPHESREITSSDYLFSLFDLSLLSDDSVVQYSYTYRSRGSHSSQIHSKHGQKAFKIASET
jgi:hypothetical protein